MFDPTRDQVRHFFFDAWRKYREREVLAALENVAVGVILLHPEYHPVLDDPERHRDREYRPESGATNPFLHMSMHLAIEAVSYTHLRAHETRHDLVCRLLLEKKKK